MASITLKNITKVYDKTQTVIENLNLEIKDREFVILVGPSGCGKSTTLRMIAGLEDITSGELYIGNKLVNNVSPKDRDIAMVFQSYALYPHMSVYKNMAFGLKLRKVPKKEIDEKVRKAAKILDIEQLLDRKPRALSGGQRQRVALGRAMVRESEVFLLDEPLSNLDAKLRTQMRREIAQLHRDLQTTFVYVTHDQTEAMTMADRIVVMKNGEIQQFDTPKNLFDHPSNMFVAGFIGSPQMNFIESRVELISGEAHLIFGGFSITVLGRYSQKLTAYNGRKVILGIRPDDIHYEESYANKNSDNKINLEIKSYEMTGAEINIYSEIDGCAVISKVDSSLAPFDSGNIVLYFDCEKLHIFDEDSEVLICD